MLQFIKIGEKANTNNFIFESYDIEEDDQIYKRIYNKSYQDNEYIFLNELTYVKLLHYNYQNEVVVGELIIHKAIIDEVKSIFEKLFYEQYQIYSIRLIDDFWIDNDPIRSDRNSVEHNNSSAFCYRNISDKKVLSTHSLGIAIDINPLENPYTPRNADGTFDTSLLSKYELDLLKDREEKAKDDKHIITLGDTICMTFDKEGFECGGIWPLQSDQWSCDWQHFEPNKYKIQQIKTKIEEIHNCKINKNI